MSVLEKQQVNNKSKLTDLILYIIAKNQVTLERNPNLSPEALTLDVIGYYLIKLY